MSSSGTGKRENWSGVLGFVLASAGSAVGLGNIWKFPYVTGLNGGGAFVLVYLLCIVVVGLPLMMCELAIGRATHKNPFGAFKQLHPHRTVMANFFGGSMLAVGIALLLLKEYGIGILLVLGALAILRWGWAATGAIAIIIPVLIISYYNVVGGWTFIYAAKSISGTGHFNDTVWVNDFFASVAGDWRYSLLGMVLFSGATLTIVSLGITKGIELVSKILMPLMFVVLIALIVRGVTLPNSEAGISFLLSPDFSKLSAKGTLEAMGHAFYTLSIGMGIVLTYGSYLSNDRNILTSACWVIGLDTLVALMAGLAIFPALFSVGMSPDAGPGLVFKIMPLTMNSFGDGLGGLWSFLFFSLLAIAAVTSSMSLLEVPVSFCIDQWKWTRRKAVFVCAGTTILLGILSALSITSWDQLPMVKSALITLVGESHIADGFFDQLDILCSSYLLPISGLMSVIFVGYVWKTKNCLTELRRGGDGMWDTNLFILLAGLAGDSHLQDKKYIYTMGVMFGLFIRIFIPLVITICFMNVIGWIKLT